MLPDRWRQDTLRGLCGPCSMGRRSVPSATHRFHSSGIPIARSFCPGIVERAPPQLSQIEHRRDSSDLTSSIVFQLFPRPALVIQARRLRTWRQHSMRQSRAPGKPARKPAKANGAPSSMSCFWVGFLLVVRNPWQIKKGPCGSACHR